MDYIAKYITRLFTWVIVSFFVVATVLYGFQMVSRIFFHTAFFWIDPLISYLFVISALSGAALASRDDENIKIDLLKKYNHFKSIEVVRMGFSSVVSMLIVMVFIGHFEVEWTKDEMDVIAPKWLLDVPYILLFLGSSFYFLHSLLKVLKRNN